MNKWDAVEKDTQTQLRYTEEVRKELVFMQYAPVLYASALTGQRIQRLGDLAAYVAEQQSLRIFNQRAE